MCTVVAKSFENDTNINFDQICCLYDGSLHILQNELHIILKSFAMKMNLFPKNILSLTQLSVDEDKNRDHSVMLIKL